MFISLLLAIGLLPQPAESLLRFHIAKDNTRQVVATLPAPFAGKLPQGRLTQEQGQAVLSVSLIDDDNKKPGPAMIGKYERAAERLTFTPRFGFDAGATYRATLTLSASQTPVTLDYRVPPPPKTPPPRVVKVYPTTDVLPANHLKFYIYFDRPMRGGNGIFDQIVLVDDKGKVIDDAWLLEELWDADNNCLIIYIHPGRIKWGVLLRQQLGPVLLENRSYSLILRGAMTDLAGNKVGKDYVKRFRTTAEDRVRIDLSAWKLHSPKAKTRDPLTLKLPKSIDHRSLLRFLSVIDDDGRKIAGTMAIGKEEKSWQFTPAQPWQARGYLLNVDGHLEDVAGNTPVLPFDVDLKAKKLAPQKLRLGFDAK